MMNKGRYVAMAALLMAIAVALGAFGAHALSSVLTERAMANWQTAVQYHLVHAVALLALAIWLHWQQSVALSRIYWGVLLGILLFSGSLYAHSLWQWKPLVFVTPIGGSVWLVSWLSLMWWAWQRGRDSNPR